MCELWIILVLLLMIRRPPRSTRTDPPLPSPTLFRSRHVIGLRDRVPPGRRRSAENGNGRAWTVARAIRPCHDDCGRAVSHEAAVLHRKRAADHPGFEAVLDRPRAFCKGFRITVRPPPFGPGDFRSEERRVGTECVSKCRSR